MSNSYTRAFWCFSPNFGDALTPWLIQKITKKPVVFSELTDQHRKYAVTGSILNWCDESCIAWGPGLANQSDVINPKVDIRAVRGPMTREIVLRSGGQCPEVFGDPALLIPDYYQPKTTQQHARIGIIPHYVDQARAYDLKMPGKVINILDTIENVIDEVHSCECILSSSLHGLIVAHAFGIPAVWVKFGEKVLGDGTKFLDHMKVMGVGQERPIPIENITSCAAPLVRTWVSVGKPTVDLAKIRGGLMNVCPFK